MGLGEGPSLQETVVWRADQGSAQRRAGQGRGRERCISTVPGGHIRKGVANQWVMLRGDMGGPLGGIHCSVTVWGWERSRRHAQALPVGSPLPQPFARPPASGLEHVVWEMLICWVSATPERDFRWKTVSG